jgi:hypothetical protein
LGLCVHGYNVDLVGADDDDYRDDDDDDDYRDDDEDEDG